MTEYVWSDTRYDLIDRWADSPRPELEQRIITVFENHPQLVIDAAEHIADRYESGLVRSPWAVLAKHVEEAADTATRSTRPVRGDRDRERARQRASQWMRTAGMHFDREDEVRDELFGERGMLRQFAGDTDLVDDLLELWHEQRPRGEQVEREAEERARRYVEQKRALARKREPEPEPEPAAAPSTSNPFL